MSALPVSQRPGVVVLAAHRPDRRLFARQLVSIAEQTRTDFRCLVGADGGQEEVRQLVAEAVGDDPRFEVIGWDDNVGVHLNVERLLAALPEDAAWVALADQDDAWYPDKLERLLPLLDDAALALGQARVVRVGGDVLRPSTRRRVVGLDDLLLQNQVTGSLAVLRTDLLDLALPFPRLDTVTQMHDHWLGACAAATGGYVVLDDVVQDYVQHDANVVGEGHGWVTRLRRDVTSVRGATRPGHGSAAALAELALGWPALVARTLRDRLGGASVVSTPVVQSLAAGTPVSLARVAGHALTSPDVGLRSTAVVGAGWLAGRLPHRRATTRRAGR